MRSRWRTEGYTSRATCTRATSLSTGLSAASLRRLARIVGLDEVDVVDELEIDRHPRILALLRAAG